LFRETRERYVKGKVQPQGVRKTSGKFFEFLPPRGKRPVQEIPAIQMQQVKNEIDDWKLNETGVL
jgi:hypothetical protein